MLLSAGGIKALAAPAAHCVAIFKMRNNSSVCPAHNLDFRWEEEGKPTSGLCFYAEGIRTAESRAKLEKKTPIRKDASGFGMPHTSHKLLQCLPSRQIFITVRVCNNPESCAGKRIWQLFCFCRFAQDPSRRLYRQRRSGKGERGRQCSQPVVERSVNFEIAGLFILSLLAAVGLCVYRAGIDETKCGEPRRIFPYILR